MPTCVKTLFYSALISGIPPTEDAQQAVELWIAQRPDDWLAYYFAGQFAAHAVRDDAAGEAYYAQAAALAPDSSMPRIILSDFALLEGRISDVARQMQRVAEDTPYSRFWNPLLLTLHYRTPEDDPLLARTGYMSALRYWIVYDDIVWKRYDAVLTDSDQLLSQAGNWSPMYIMVGYAQCNRGVYAAAIATFSARRVYDPGYMMLYLMRADAYLEQGMEEEALADLVRIEASPQAERYAPYVEAVKQRQIGCDNMFDIDALRAADLDIVYPTPTPTPTATP